MKTQRIAILLLVLALIVGLEAVMMTRCTGTPSSAPRATATPEPSPEATDDPNATPLPSPMALNTARPGFTSPPDIAGGSGGSNNTTSATRAPSATQRPDPTKAPAPTAAPTSAPTQAPPAGTVTASNSFSSSTGVGLNMSVSWTATDLGNGTTRITINGTVNSYELHVMRLPVSISFSGYSASITGNGIDVGDGLHSTTLFSTSMDVASGTSGTMTVTWNYNGEYSGTSISAITASDFVYTD